ncbi:MAG: anthranilate synthase component I family protein [Pseudomonadota bacterium]
MAQASAFDILADTDTPVSAWLKLKALRPRYLLESVEQGQRVARFSFLGFGDVRLTRIEDGQLRDASGHASAAPQTQDELLDALRGALEQAPALLPELPEIPFRGGLVGVAGYDVVRRFERLPDAPPPPSMPEAAYMATESLLVFDHLTRRVALLHSGEQTDRVRLRDQVVELLRGPLPVSAGAGGQVGEAAASLSRAEFCEHVAAAREHIAAGDIYQIVLSVCFSGKTDVQPFEVYRALRLLNPSPYMFFCDFDDLQVAGSSPEALVRLSGSSASLRPIAGTLPRGDTEAQDESNAERLLADPKERAEHVMLVDLARNDLGRVAAPGTVGVSPYMSIERYSHVMHIVSGVEGQLDEDKDAFDLFAAAFPAGTLVGAPKVRAMELIDGFEPVGRGLYAGTVGYFGQGGDMDQAITIRTLVFRDGEFSFQAGAGIVADSVPDKEYDEVLAKSAILRRALSLAGEGL